MLALHSSRAPTVSPSIARSDKSPIWRSDDSSLLRPIGEGGGLLSPSLTTSFLSISGAALVEGSAYIISVSAKGSWVDQQVHLNKFTIICARHKYSGCQTECGRRTRVPQTSP